MNGSGERNGDKLNSTEGKHARERKGTVGVVDQNSMCLQVGWTIIQEEQLTLGSYT